MQIEDTKTKIYIHDLDAELEGEISDDEGAEHLIFLPDIDRQLQDLSKQLLISDTNVAARGNELVLYSVPKSLSVPEAEDGVHKAIAEARARARERSIQIEPSSDAMLHDEPHEQNGLGDYDNNDDDGDAMEIG